MSNRILGIVAGVLLVLLAGPRVLPAQSLTQVAKEEKERRKKIKDSGKQIVVITDKELAANQGKIANPSGETSSSEGASSPQSTESSGVDDESRPAPGNPPVNDAAAPREESTVTEIPSQGSLQEKLSAFEAMKASYASKVKEIDQEIQKNNQRLSEIQDQLVSTGGTGLPTAPQADRAPRNPADVPGLRAEQQQLRDKNQALEAQKQTLKNDILSKARRAGIPPGYLAF
jgi:hypothetical protein